MTPGIIRVWIEENAEYSSTVIPADIADLDIGVRDVSVTRQKAASLGIFLSPSILSSS
jgi:hypothetical protein